MTIESDQAVFWRRADKPLRVVAVAAPTTATVGNRRIRISTDAFERLFDVAPRWDKHMLESLYIEWARDKDAARSEDARFIGWVKSYTKGKPAP